MSKAEKVVFGRDFFVIDPAKCALLIIDMQNSFVEPGAVYEAPNARRIIPNINRLARAARQKNIPIVWTQSDHSPPGGGLILQKHPVIREEQELWRGHRSFEIYAGSGRPGATEPEMVQPQPGDLRVVKHKFDAFFGTDLDMLLGNLGKDTVIITGIATEVCCESTARSAFFREYKVVFLRDANEALDPRQQEPAFERLDFLFARVITTEELLGALDGAELDAGAATLKEAVGG
jgi:ureidoacrylate peracid hydrolase